jgi:hypothetical protein
VAQAETGEQVVGAIRRATAIDHPQLREAVPRPEFFGWIEDV